MHTEKYLSGISLTTNALFFPAIWCIKSEWEHFEHCWWPLAHSGKLLTLKVWKTCIVLFMEIYTHIEVLLQFWEDHLYSYLFARLHLPDLPRRRIPCGLKCNLLGEWKMTDISCWRLKKMSHPITDWPGAALDRNSSGWRKLQFYAWERKLFWNCGNNVEIFLPKTLHTNRKSLSSFARWPRDVWTIPWWLKDSRVPKYTH